MEELSPHGVEFVTHRDDYFDTVTIDVKKSGFSSSDFLLAEMHKHGINIRKIDESHVSVSFDEITTLFDLDLLIELFTSIKKNRIHDLNYVPFEEYENR